MNLRTSWIPGTGYGTVHVIQQSAIGQIQMRNACSNQYIQYILKELLGRKFPFSKVGIVEVGKRSKVACAGWFSFLSEVHTASVISFTLGIKKKHLFPAILCLAYGKQKMLTRT